MATPIWYNILLACIQPLYRWRVKSRSGHLADYADEVCERFGPFQTVKNTQAIWFHAVSVGETNAAQPLIEHYLQQGQAVLITNTTRTGQARAKLLFASRYPDLFQAVFLPVDRIELLERFIELNQPKLVLLMETELWPNLLSLLQQKHIPALLLNARLSEKSAKGYAKVKSLTYPMLQQLNGIAAQDQATAARFKQLGAHNVKILGNVKFDIAMPSGLRAQAEQLKQDWQLSSREIIVIASTHHPEEQQLLAALSSQLQHNPKLLCIVVPRHPERFDEVFKVVSELGLKVGRRSLQQAITHDTQVYLADSMGEMWLWFALAKVAFIGGSLNEPGGGHNILEPIAAGVATVIGKNYFNFQSIVDEFAQQEALKVVADAAQAVEQMLRLLEDTQYRDAYNVRAQQILQQNQGSVSRHVAFIEQYLS